MARDALVRKQGSFPVRFVRGWDWKKTAWVLLFLAPYLIGFIVFMGGPIVAVLGLSFTKWDILTPPVFVELENYRKILFQDKMFWKSLRNTVTYIAMVVPLEVILAFFLSVLINRRIRGINIYRAIFFMPFVLSLASIGLLWTWLYSADFGLVGFIFNKLHIPSPMWLYDPKWAMPSIVFTTLWRNVGYYMVIFLAGLQGIPRDLYEAAELDGAAAWQKLRHVTIPLLSPTTFFILVIAVIWAFHVFDLIYIMTGGGRTGNIDATITLVYYLYEVGFRWFQMGMASALAVILLALTMVVTAIQFAVQKKWVHYQ
jgi:multiple sugar transport system permease protein